VIQVEEASASGSISSAIETAIKANVDIAQTVEASASGLAEAAIEASVDIDLEFSSSVRAAAAGAAAAAVRSATKTDMDVAEMLKTVTSGINQGAFSALSGKGSNIRIFIAPTKDSNLFEVQQAINSGIFEGAKRARYIPIIETPYEDDPTVRQVSPI
jgi:hypothetical protein